MKKIDKLVLASNNAGKVREINAILADIGIEVLPQGEFGTPEIEETGLTFVENAILKARNAAHYAGLPALADDSGIEVDALHGAPGIYSARFAGSGASDADNLHKLLAQLEDIPDAQRTARFQCLMVLMEHEADPTPMICQGTWEGRITHAAAGESGFGYDPVFHVPTHNCTAAELDAAEKNRISHRAQALQCLLRGLRPQEQ